MVILYSCIGILYYFYILFVSVIKELYCLYPISMKWTKVREKSSFRPLDQPWLEKKQCISKTANNSISNIELFKIKDLQE